VDPDNRRGILDRLVAFAADTLDAMGLNGRRLRWRWEQRRHNRDESQLRREMHFRAAKGRHKMCPACRELVDRNAAECPECNEPLRKVKAPGLGRTLGNLFPGATATTSLLMLVNGFWFVMMLLAQAKSGEGGGISLFGGFSFDVLKYFGSGLYAPYYGEGGEWWRLVTPIFLHGGLLHFFFNSYLLLQLGPVVEEIYGTKRYWVAYLACGLAGSLFSQRLRFVIGEALPFTAGFLGRYVNTVGASGAIMGLIGLLLVHGIRDGGALGQAMKSMIKRLLIYMVVLSFFFNLDHMNHLGGFACGAALGLLLQPGRSRSQIESLIWQLLGLAGVLVVLWAFFEVGAYGQLSLDR